MKLCIALLATGFVVLGVVVALLVVRGDGENMAVTDKQSDHSSQAPSVTAITFLPTRNPTQLLTEEFTEMKRSILSGAKSASCFLALAPISGPR